MIKALEEMISRVRTWPTDRQEDVARTLEAMESTGTNPYHLSDTERAAIEAGLAQAKRGEFVSDEDMIDFWNRNRR